MFSALIFSVLKNTAKDDVKWNIFSAENINFFSREMSSISCLSCLNIFNKTKGLLPQTKIDALLFLFTFFTMVLKCAPSWIMFTSLPFARLTAYAKIYHCMMMAQPLKSNQIVCVVMKELLFSHFKCQAVKHDTCR